LIGLGTLAFLLAAGRPNAGAVAAGLSLLPMVLLLAALNAFSEEAIYRSAFLGTLGSLPRSQAVLLSATFFGIAHYYGVPYGLLGVLMAGLLGWLLAKAMVETHSFFWPWFIHFLQDVLIFAMMALGAVAA
jgi:membrane protease YdiL (CAAX protease family)